MNQTVSDYRFKFSVVTAVYNVEPYLAEAIESILTQDIGFEESVEIILVDDGSTDRSGAICDEYQQKFPANIKVIHKENGGASSARNNILRKDSFSCAVITSSGNFFIRKRARRSYMIVY